MLDIIVNLLFIAMMLGFLVLVLKELGQSQKAREDLQIVPDMMCLRIDLKRPDGQPPQRIIHHAETLAELQDLLNSISTFRILRAGVWKGTNMTYVMNGVGILEVV